MSFVDPPFDSGVSGTSGDDHPLSDIRLGERFIADAYHALADYGYLDDTVLIITFDEWGGFYDHVAAPKVVDDTNPADIMHAGDSTTPTDGQLVPDYSQLGFRVPAIVVSNLVRPRRVVHSGPFQHCSSLALIESTFGLKPLTTRDRYARDLQQLLLPSPVPPGFTVPPSSIPTSAEVIGPAISSPSEPLLQVLSGPANLTLPRCAQPKACSRCPRRQSTTHPDPKSPGPSPASRGPLVWPTSTVTTTRAGGQTGLATWAQLVVSGWSPVPASRGAGS